MPLAVTGKAKSESLLPLVGSFLNDSVKPRVCSISKDRPGGGGGGGMHALAVSRVTYPGKCTFQMGIKMF